MMESVFMKVWRESEIQIKLLEGFCNYPLNIISC
jgi:hypothetical protein